MSSFVEIEKESSPRRGKEVSIADFQSFQSHDSAIQPKLVVLQNNLREEEILPLDIHFGMSLNFLLHKRPLSAYSLNLPKKGSLRKHLKSNPFDGHLERLKDGISSDAIEGERSQLEDNLIFSPSTPLLMTHSNLSLNPSLSLIISTMLFLLNRPIILRIFLDIPCIRVTKTTRRIEKSNING